ncbi:MAG: ABC transporter permease [Terriglobales bacterium]
MTSKAKIWMAAIVLVLLHALVVFAGFVAPADPTSQNRDFPFVPPSRLHFVDSRGHFHLRPFVYAWISKPQNLYEYEESRDREYPVHFFVKGPEYRVGGVFSSSLHLFGMEAPAQIFLAGTDNYGRDQFSRIVYGGRISLAAGLLATAISLSLGLLLGTISGFYGSWIDESLMRMVELFLVLPWLYLLLAVRAFLPLHISPVQTFFLLVAVIGSIGWARPARLVRGVVLSARSRKYVLASRGFGASDRHILRRHLLPHTYGVLLTQAALLVPQYVIAEVTLSFLGLGLSEPMPSWGNLLANLQQYNVLVSYWWMFAPGLALLVFSLGYLAMADAIQQRLQSTTV